MDLQNDRESVHEFRVPENVSKISFALRGKVQNLSKAKKEDLAAERVYEMNGIDATAKIEDLHLRHIAGEYIVELLGKTGEPKPDRAVYLKLKHRHFKLAMQCRRGSLASTVAALRCWHRWALGFLRYEREATLPP